MPKKPTQQWNAQPFESKGKNFTTDSGHIRHDTFAAIYESQLQSKAYKALTNRQKMLYVYCKAQYFGKRKPSADYPDLEQFQSPDCFYLNLASICSYGLYTRNMRKEFYGDMRELEAHGFIKKLSSGRSTKTKNIYKFSDEWKTWEN